MVSTAIRQEAMTKERRRGVRVLTVTINTGDANVDGDVTEADVKAVAKYIIGQTPTGFDREAADVNGDKKIDAADIVGIVKIIK